MTGAYQLHRKVHASEQLSYAAGDAGFNLLWVLFDSFLLYFLIGVAHLPVWSITPIVFWSRIADFAASIAFGLFGDRLRTRFGTYRPYLSLVALPLPMFSILMFTTPLHATGVPPGWVALWTTAAAVIFAAFYAVGNAAYTALLAVLTPDENVRLRMASLRFAFAAASVVAVQYFVPELSGRLGAVRGWTVSAVLCATGCGVALLVTVMGTHEQLAPPAPVHLDLRRVVREAMRARELGWLALAMVLCLAALSCRGAASPFFLQEQLGQARWLGSALAANSLAAFLVCAIIPATVPRRWLEPNRLACACCSAGAALCLVTPLWVAASHRQVVLLQLSFGAATGLLVPSLFVLLASKAQTSAEVITPAFRASVTLLALKIGSAAGALLASSALTHAGASDVLLRSGPNATSLFTLWPALLFGLSLLCLLAARRHPQAHGKTAPPLAA